MPGTVSHDVFLNLEKHTETGVLITILEKLSTFETWIITEIVG